MIRAGLLALLTAVALAIAAAGASALVVRLPNGHKVSYVPLRGAPTAASTFAAPFAKRHKEPMLLYHGGPIMPSNTNYTLYWRPSGAPAYPADYRAGVNGFLEDLAHDSGGLQNVDSLAA